VPSTLPAPGPAHDGLRGRRSQQYWARGGPPRCFPDERRRRDEGAPRERGGKAARIPRPAASG